MNYEEALNYIHSTKKFSTKPGLLRVENLLAEMGNPHKKMRYVHIAGTNGKGSSTAMVASVLQRAGYRTGTFVSPYLERFNERMQVDGIPITDDELAALTEKTKNHITNIVRKGIPHPTEFELLTAMAFYYWAEKGCDFVSLEVGMGGRLDATNVIDPPEVAMIMSISFDHTHYLGNTLEEIAWEKCGIIKPGSDVICYIDQEAEAYETIASITSERGANLITPYKKDIEILMEDTNGSTIKYKGLEATIPLVGLHQIYNAVSVIEACLALKERGFNITDTIIAEGLSSTKWVGRLEKISDSPLCIIDAAHNPGAVTALALSIDRLYSDKHLITVFGILADKNYEFCIPEVAKRSAIFIGTTPDSGRALEADETAKIASKYCSEVYVEPSISHAVDKAFELAGEGDMVLICGSLYVIGAAKTYIREHK